MLPRLQRERYDNDKDKNHEGRDRKSAFGFALNEAKDFEEKTVAIGRHAGLRCTGLASQYSGPRVGAN